MEQQAIQVTQELTRKVHQQPMQTYHHTMLSVTLLSTQPSSGDVGVSRVAILKDEKGNQASGGTFYSGGWRDRDLTVEEDPSNFVDFTAGGSTGAGSAGNTIQVIGHYLQETIR